jgi:paraquat-inducible protein B
MPNSTPEARFRLPLIWIVPLVSLFVAGFLVHRELKDRGPRITVRFGDAAGLVPGQTKVMYKGLPMGFVQEIALLPDRSGVELKIDLERGAANVAREDSRFWIVRPQISLSGVRDAETLLTGPVITVDPGEGKARRDFVGLESPPTDIAGTKGVAYVLRATKRGSLAPGRPVTFRGMLVGEVKGVELSPDASAVMVHIEVDDAYAGLVRPDTQFWVASGLDVNFSLFHGASIRTGAMDELLAGGIAFATPDAAEPPPEAGHEFVLHESAKDEWIAWASPLPLDGTALDKMAPAAKRLRSGGAH